MFYPLRFACLMIAVIVSGCSSGGGGGGAPSVPNDPPPPAPLVWEERAATVHDINAWPYEYNGWGRGLWDLSQYEGVVLRFAAGEEVLHVAWDDPYLGAVESELVYTPAVGGWRGTDLVAVALGYGGTTPVNFRITYRESPNDFAQPRGSLWLETNSRQDMRSPNGGNMTWYIDQDISVPELPAGDG
jgi:hypothetical protein